MLSNQPTTTDQWPPHPKEVKTWTCGRTNLKNHFKLVSKTSSGWGWWWSSWGGWWRWSWGGWWWCSETNRWSATQTSRPSANSPDGTTTMTRTTMMETTMMTMAMMVMTVMTVMTMIKCGGSCVCRVGFHPCAATQCYNYMATLSPPSFIHREKIKTTSEMHILHIAPWYFMKSRFLLQFLIYSHNVLVFLSDPGVPGVRSMGPVLWNWLTDWESFCRLNWCDSGWWRYQLNTNW